MRMTNARNILGSPLKLHNSHSLGNQLGNLRSYHMNPKHLVSFCVCQNLDKAINNTQRTGTTVGHEGETADLVVSSFFFEGLLGLPDPGDLRCGVQNPRNRIEIHMWLLSGNPLSYCDAFILSLVRQHGAAHYIPNRPNVGQVGPTILIDHDKPLLIELQTYRISPQTFGIGYPAYGDNQFIYLELLLLALAICVFYFHSGFGFLDIIYLGTQLYFQALFGKYLERLLSLMTISGKEKIGHPIKNGHLGTKTTPYATQLQANHASTNHPKFFGNLGQTQRPIIGQDGFLIKVQPG